MSRRFRRLPFSAWWLGAALAVAAPSSAQAVPIAVFSGNLLLVQGRAADEAIVTEPYNGQVKIVGVGSADADGVGTNCTANTPEPGSMVCANVKTVEIYGGGGNDRLRAIGGPNISWDTYLYGELGNDELTTSVSQTVLMDGGVGSDTLTALGTGGIDRHSTGGPGDDVLVGSDNARDEFVAEPGADTYRGGTVPPPPGYTGTWRQQFTYDSYEADQKDPTPVTVTLNGVADDGRPGEGDNVGPDVEALEGSSGNDTLDISGAQQADGGLYGGAGDDLLVGSDGNDYITDGPGDDRVRAGGGDDTLMASDVSLGPVVQGSTDTVDLGAGDDMYVAKAQRCTQPTKDQAQGGLGPDVLAGGPGNDTVEMAYRASTDNGCAFGKDNYVGMSISLDGVANDGAPGQGANVLPDVENVMTGAGDDTITGSDASNVLWSFEGNDTIDPLGGIDLVGTGPGIDKVVSADGFSDWIDCGEDEDGPLVGDNIDILVHCEGPRSLRVVETQHLDPTVVIQRVDPDTVPAKVTVPGKVTTPLKRLSRTHQVRLPFAADEPVKVQAWATSARLVKGLEVSLARVSTPTFAPKGEIVVRLSRAQIAQVRAAVGVKPVAIRMNVIAIDAGGNTTPVNATVSVTR